MTAQIARMGIILVICAPSGAGKTTLIKRLLNEFPSLTYSVSCTTRQPREGEVHGVDYYFIDRERFLVMRSENAFAEWAEVHGNLYGTPLNDTWDMLNKGQDVIFDIDVQGACQLKESLGALGAFIFISPPSKAELLRRLRARGTESDAAVIRRLNNAESELREAHWFDALIINDDIEQAYDDLRAVYLAETLVPGRQRRFADLLKEWESDVVSLSASSESKAEAETAAADNALRFKSRD